MKNKKTYFENTIVPVNKTINQITEMLVESGCTGISMEYGKDLKITSLYFKIIFLEKTIPFKLPCRTNNLIKFFKDQGKYINQEKAEMIAWRQTFHWVKAQLAMIGTNMVKVYEVFLPYQQVDAEGTTVFETIEKKGFLALEHKQ